MLLLIVGAALAGRRSRTDAGFGPTAAQPLGQQAAAAPWTGDLCAGGGAGGGGGGVGASGVVVAGGGKSDIASTFASIYATLRWGADGEGSGAGSTLRATAGTRALVEMLVWRHRVTRLLDAPCGSAHWWPPLLARIRAFAPCFEYAGLDVVPSVVAANAAKPEFAGDARVSLAVADLSAPGALRPAGYDMILCRDALQHIPLLDAIDVLENFARARARVVALGSYLDPAARWDRARNADIRVGEYYHISLLAPPFNMSAPDSMHVLGGGPRGRGEPLDILDELTPHSDPREHKYLLVYSGEYLASLDFAAMRASAVQDFFAVPRGLAPVPSHPAAGVAAQALRRQA